MSLSLTTLVQRLGDDATDTSWLCEVIQCGRCPVRGDRFAKTCTGLFTRNAGQRSRRIQGQAMSLVDCRSTTARWPRARCPRSSNQDGCARLARSADTTSRGLLQLFSVRGSGSERGSTPLFGPPPVELSAFIAGFVNSMPSNFIPCLAYPLFSRKRPCQKTAQKYAHIFSFRLVDNPQSFRYIQPQNQGPRPERRGPRGPL